MIFSEITKKNMKKSPIILEGNDLRVKLEQRLDATNALKLIEMLDKYREEDEITRVIFDATELVYIASTGIRAVIYADQVVGNNPTIVFVGANEDVKKVFTTTGVADYLTFVDSL